MAMIHESPLGSHCTNNFLPLKVWNNTTWIYIGENQQ